jgi:hypothetical protein
MSPLEKKVISLKLLLNKYNMREWISNFVGQAGVPMGNSCWELFV